MASAEKYAGADVIVRRFRPAEHCTDKIYIPMRPGRARRFRFKRSARVFSAAADADATFNLMPLLRYAAARKVGLTKAPVHRCGSPAQARQSGTIDQNTQ